LGSGTGILGMIISKIIFAENQSTSTTAVDSTDNDSCIVLTDGDDKAVDLLQLNLTNTKNNIKTSHVKATNLLWWGQQDFSLDCRLDFLRSIQQMFTLTQNIDEKHDNKRLNTETDHDDDDVTSGSINHMLFDYIVAGDVLYKKDLPEKFFYTAYTLLKQHEQSTGTHVVASTDKRNNDNNNKHNCCLWLCHVPRNGVTQDIVQNAAMTAGFAFTIIPLDDITLPEDYCPIDDLSRAVIYKMTVAVH
jgi:hypothetical protein